MAGGFMIIHIHNTYYTLTNAVTTVYMTDWGLKYMTQSHANYWLRLHSKWLMAVAPATTFGSCVSLAFSVFTPESGRLCHCKTWSRFLSADALPVTTGDWAVKETWATPAREITHCLHIVLIHQTNSQRKECWIIYVSLCHQHIKYKHT